MLQKVNFTCCQEPECDIVAKRLIADFSGILKTMDNLEIIRALILTGSFARGEGSILKLSEQSYKILGDIEFLAVLNYRSDLEYIQKSIINSQEVFKEKLKRERIECKVEVTPALPRFFKGLRPRIFDYELLQHGKTIWGERAYLDNIPRFSPKNISKVDPIYLLFNRIVEQLALLLVIQDEKDANPIDSIYQMAKVYIDLATSILAYKGNFEDTYLNRSKRFGELLCSHVLGNEEEVADHIAEKVAYWTEVKLRPKLEHFIPASILNKDKKYPNSHLLFQWMQVAQIVRSILSWEICDYLHLPETTDLEKILWSFSKSFKITHRIKEWIKFQINPKVPSNEKSLKRTVRLLRKGSPRTLIYFCSALLYFDIAEKIANGGNMNTWRIDSSIKAFIPTGPENKETTPFDLIRHLLRDWELYLRNN